MQMFCLKWRIVTDRNTVMRSGIRRKETWTLYDEHDRPTEVNVLVLVFPGPQEVIHWESGRTADGRRLKPHGAGAYITDDGIVLSVLPSGAGTS
jgi:hypothetical protein